MLVRWEEENTHRDSGHPGLAPSRHLLSAVGSSKHPAGVDQRPPTEVPLVHEDAQWLQGLQRRLPWVLARCALKASIDSLDFPVCYLGLPA